MERNTSSGLLPVVDGGSSTAGQSEEMDIDLEHLSGQDLLGLAHIAGQVGRPNDAVRYLYQAGETLYESAPDVEFQLADRELLTKSLRLVINPIRNAVRSLSEKAESGDGPPELEEYIQAKSAQLHDKCRQVIDVIAETFLPLASEAESRIFFNKVAGDQARYICELPLPSDPTPAQLAKREQALQEALSFYQTALEEAQSDLAPTDALRLGLILNYAIFCYEIKEDKQLATELASTAYEDAVVELESDPPLAASASSVHQQSEQQGDSADTPKMWNEEEGLSEEASSSGQKEPGAAETNRVLGIIKASLDRWNNA